MIEGMVSAILPTFNRLELLKNSIGALIGQSYKNWELIIVDDNSTDRTEDFCNTLLLDTFKQLSLPNKVKYIKLNENSGSTSIPRNIGISHSEGEFIAPIDDDVYSTNLKFELLVKCFEDKNITLAYGERVNTTIDENGELVFGGVSQNDDWNPLETWGVDGGQYIYRSNVYTKYPLVFSRRACDWNTAKSIISDKSEVIHIDSVVCIYLWHATNRSVLMTDNKIDYPIFPKRFEQYFNINSEFIIDLKEEV